MSPSTIDDDHPPSRLTRRFIANVDLYPDVSHHGDAIEARFVLDPHFVHQGLAELTSEKTIVFVCFSNRSGSNLLLDTLGRIGFGCEAGDEFFNGDAVSDHLREYGFKSFEEYLEFAIKLHGFRRCVFLKIGAHQLFWLANRGILGKYFPQARYLLTERADKIHQAVSLYIADETRSYIRLAGNDVQDRAKVDYSAEQIMIRLRRIIDATSLFRYFFSLHSVAAHSVQYEELDADAIGVLQRLSTHLGSGGDFPRRWEIVLRNQSPRIVRQADRLNMEFADRFRREFAISDVASLPD